jgi:hypothetical protein
MKRMIKNDNNGSAFPVVILIVCLCVASVVILIINYVVEPFLNLMNSYDTVLKPSVTAPRRAVVSVTVPLWEKALPLVIIIGLGIGLLMEYQKSKYRQDW